MTERLRVLGDGSSAVVWLVRMRSGTLMALKVFKRNYVDCYNRELRASEEIKAHTNVTLAVATGVPYQLIMPRADTDLFELLTKCPDGLGRGITTEFTRQLCSGLEHIHTCGFCHTDLKLENILVSRPGVLSIADFGLARQMGTIVNGPVGTLAYLAPETFGKHVVRSSIDVWQLGILVFCMLTSRQLFAGSSLKEMRRAIHGELPLESIAVDARDFIADALTLNPLDRPTVRELCVYEFLS